MNILPVHLFKDSFGPFLTLLNEHGIQYQMREVRAGVPMASGGTLELVQAVGNAAFWASLATVVVAFINSRRGRKVIITTKDGTVVHAEGLSPSELEQVLQKALNLTAIDPNKTPVIEAKE
jgi:Effector Associated Constant Component 1